MDHFEDAGRQVYNQLQVLQKRGKQRMRYRKQLDHEMLQNRFLKKLTILHSNDMHGDFLAEKVDSGLIGGISMLSGYINMV